jgi:DNA ligase-1
MVFDVPHLQGANGKPAKFEERLAFMQSTFPANKVPFVKVVPMMRCKDAAHLALQMKKVIAAGGEGMMLRRPQSYYTQGRSNVLLKGLY